MSRDQVIEAATRMVAAGDFEQMTIRGLARELGMAPMSLYRHVHSKDDLLSEVVDRLLAEVWRPKTRTTNWRRWVAEASDNLRAFLCDQPAALHVYLRQPVVSPVNVERMETIMDVLRTGLPDEAAARPAYAAIQTYTIGFAALEAARAGWSPTAAPGDLANELASYTSPHQFAEGLDYLLEGIVQRAASDRRDATPRRRRTP